MSDSKKFWDRFAEMYIKSPIKDEATYQRKLAITKEYLRPDSKLLEFGCGSGATAMIHAAYVEHVVATDISDKMIESAQKKAAELGVRNVSFQQGVLEDLALQSESFDVVLGLNVLHLLPDVDSAIAKVSQLLGSDGVFISSTSLVSKMNFVLRWLLNGMHWLGLAPFVGHLTKEQLFAKLGSAGFTIEREWQPNQESIFVVARKLSNSQ